MHRVTFDLDSSELGTLYVLIAEGYSDEAFLRKLCQHNDFDYEEARAVLGRFEIILEHKIDCELA